MFFDSLLPFLIPLLDDDLHIIVGAFNQDSIVAFTIFDVSGLFVSRTRGNSTLNGIIIKHPKLFPFNPRIQVSTSGHSLLILKR